MNKQEKNYHILGINPGSSWETLRNAYKLAVRRWHPDRFPHDAVERDRAEEKIKVINGAYRELQNYYEQHGILPLDGNTTPSTSPPAGAESYTSTEHRSAEPSDLNQSGWGPMLDRSGPTDTGRLGSLFWMAVAAILMALAYFLLYPDESDSTPATSLVESMVVNPALGNQSEQTTNTDNKKYFTVGSSFDGVYSIQGTPTNIETNYEEKIWHYGDALVFFREGKVTHWIDSAAQQLRVAENLRTDKGAASKSFGRGSTKNDVLAILGKPIQETDRVWDYGASQIYFDANRVTGWHGSSLFPLQTDRQIRSTDSR